MGAAHVGTGACRPQGCRLSRHKTANYYRVGGVFAVGYTWYRLEQAFSRRTRTPPRRGYSIRLGGVRATEDTTGSVIHKAVPSDRTVSARNIGSRPSLRRSAK